MTDPRSAAVAFGAGLVSSAGPCVAARLAAVVGLTAGCAQRERFVRTGAFVLGLCVGYVALGSAVTALNRVGPYSTYAYLCLGGWLTLAGIRKLVEMPARHRCASGEAGRSATPLGRVFVAGSAFAIVGSPCCGPLGAASAAAFPGIGIAASAVVPLAFALGHAVPLVAVANGLNLATAPRMHLPAWSVSTVAGAVMLALGSYYALIA